MNPKNLRAMFSLITGEIFYIQEDEIKNFNQAHVVLKETPKGNCKKCYGRFHVGREITKNYYIPCPRCMRKYADWDAMKQDEIFVERPQTTTDIADKTFIDAMNKIPGR